MTDNVCPICGEGQLTSNVEQREVTYKNVTQVIASQFSTCDVCGSDITNSEEARANKRAIIRFHKQVDGMLTGEEIQGIRHKYNITQQEAAALFGGGIAAFSKYENDDIVQNTSMDRLLRVVDALPMAYKWLNSNYGSSGLSSSSSQVVIENNEWIQGKTETIATLYHDVRGLEPIAGGDVSNQWETVELKLVNG